MNAEDKQLAAAECIDAVEGAAAPGRIRGDAMGSGDAVSEEVAAVQGAPRGAAAKPEVNARRLGVRPPGTKNAPREGRGFRMVVREGLEPPARGFSVPCSTN